MAPSAPRRPPPLRIGIARDRAFGFYYPDDLEALAAGGADPVFFDTLRDNRLPRDLDGLFIGGGFPETCLEALEDNLAMRLSLAEAIRAGLPTYAECGGLMLLARSIRWGERHAEMVGIIPGDAVMHDRPVGRGYVHLAETEAMPWPETEVGRGEREGCADHDAHDGHHGRSAAAPIVRAHEFHYASLEGLPAGQRYAWRVLRGHGIDGRHDGLVLHHLLASFSHLRHGAGLRWVERFLAHVRTVRWRDVQAASASASASAEPDNGQCTSAAPRDHLRLVAGRRIRHAPGTPAALRRVPAA